MMALTVLLLRGEAHLQHFSSKDSYRPCGALRVMPRGASACLRGWSRLLVGTQGGFNGQHTVQDTYGGGLPLTAPNEPLAHFTTAASDVLSPKGGTLSHRNTVARRLRPPGCAGHLMPTNWDKEGLTSGLGDCSPLPWGDSSPHREQWGEHPHLWGPRHPIPRTEVGGK